MQYIPRIRQLFSLIGYIFGSWILVHVMALFGFFLSAAYPIWWLFFPKKVLCIFCRFGQEKGRCRVCKQPVDPEHMYPKTFLSAGANAAFLSVLTVFFVAIVFVEGFVLGSLLPDQPTAYFSIPTKGQYQVGDTVKLVVELKDIRQPINVVQSDISFDPSILELQDIVTANSFASIFIQKEINNELGYARLVGGIPNPGFSGDAGLFAVFEFTALGQGATEVVFLPSSLVLANNGKGTNLLKEYGTTQYLVLPKQFVEDGGQGTEIEFRDAPVSGNTSSDTTTSKTQIAQQDVRLELYDSFSVVLGSSVVATDSPEKPSQGPTPTPTQEAGREPFWLTVLKKLHSIDKKIISFYTSLFS